MDARPRASHIFPREQHEHYVEPSWCSKRLFDVERFQGVIVDPACGWGTIVINALAAGYVAAGSDIVARGWDSTATPSDFMESSVTRDNIVTNPPLVREGQGSRCQWHLETWQSFTCLHPRPPRPRWAQGVGYQGTS